MDGSSVRFRELLRNKGFRYLWFNQILIQLSYNAINFALIIWVFKLVRTEVAVSALMLSIYSPAILFGLFAGVFVDILDRRKLIILIDFVIALCFALFIFIKASFVLILFDTFIINSLAQFFMPSESSSIPMLVSEKQLFLANSLFSLTFSAALMIGYSIAGPILNVLGINAIFILGSGILLIASLLAQNLPPIKVLTEDKKFEGLLNFNSIDRLIRVTYIESKLTLKLIREKVSVFAAIIILSGMQGVVGVLAVLMPSYLETVLKIHATDSSYFVMFPLGIGMILGIILGNKFWFHKLPRRLIVIPAIIVSGLIFILVGATPIIVKLLQLHEIPIHLMHPRYFFRAPSISSYFALGAMILGFATVSIIIPCQTVLQENTPEKDRGKVFAVLAVIMTSFAALPVFLAGILSDSFGAATVFLGLGLIIFILGMLAYSPSLFFKEKFLPYKLREFLGLEHWQKGNKGV